jgi:hypothetical protein
MSLLTSSRLWAWLFFFLSQHSLVEPVTRLVPMQTKTVQYIAQSPTTSNSESSITAERVEPDSTPSTRPMSSAKAITATSTNAPQPSNWDGLLQQYFGANWIRAHKIMMCESGGRPGAIGPMDSHGFQPIGLFQIKDFADRPSRAALMVGASNIAYAAGMSLGGTVWTAWECKG